MEISPFEPLLSSPSCMLLRLHTIFFGSYVELKSLMQQTNVVVVKKKHGGDHCLTVVSLMRFYHFPWRDEVKVICKVHIEWDRLTRAMQVQIFMIFQY